MGVILGSIIIPTLQSAVPTSWWITMNSIELAPSEDNACPTMTVSRSISKRFIGTWSYSLFRITKGIGEDDGPDIWTLIATRSGDRTYLPSEGPVMRAILSQRLGIELSCPLDPGDYVMIGRIRPNPRFWAPEGTTAQSNVLTVE